MSEHIEAVKPCERGCLRPDDTPMAATHGEYCSRCWGRLSTALSIAGELAQHLVGNAITSSSGDGDRVDNSRDAPVPFNAAAFDDASELYAALVYWVTVWADALRTKLPNIAARAWRNDRGQVVGLPAGTTAENASGAVSNLAGWIRDRLDSILSLGRHDDVDAFTDTITDVWRMNARWPRIERPSYSAMPCPREDCGARIAVYPPAHPGDDRRIVCTAGHWYPEEEYEHLRLVFMQVAREKAQTERTVKHLSKKYGIGRTAS